MIRKLKETFKKALSHAVLHCSDDGLHYAYFDKASDIPAHDWNSTFNADHRVFNDIAYLNAIEHFVDKRMSVRYLLVYKKERPIAAFYFQLFKLNGLLPSQLINETYFEQAATFIKEMKDQYIFGKSNEDPNYILICGNLFNSESTGFEVLSTEKSSIRLNWKKIYYDLEMQMEPHSEIIAHLFKDYGTSHHFQIDTLLAERYGQFQIDPEMHLTLKWPTFEDYLADLSTKYRTRIKSALEKSKHIEVRYLSHEDINQNHVSINRLFQNVFNNAPVRLAALHGGCFIDMRKVLADKCIFIGFFYEQNLIGFATGIVDGAMLNAQFVGFDTADNKTHNLYMRILIEYIRTGISMGMKKINFGRDALEIKSTFGAMPVPLSLFYYFPGLRGKIISGMFDKFVKPKEWIQRRPFKEKEEVNV
ncbi:MAG: N-acetyltransferase [Bacteroidetes bacterium]|nr:N-acetyltransferase [Bacteroidota bacterium]